MMAVEGVQAVTQKHIPNSDLVELMKVFTEMVNHTIRIGLKEGAHNMKRLSGICYHELRDYDILSPYKLCAVSQAAGILSNRKTVKRGRKVRIPIMKNPFITNHGVKANRCLLAIPYKSRNPINILLNGHTQKILSDHSLTVRYSLTAASISISKEAEIIQCSKTVGIDRNLRNVTCGNEQEVAFYRTNKLLSIKEDTIHARAGFHRNDRRKKVWFWKERQKRMAGRTRQHIHRISKDIVENAVKSKSMIVLENLKGIRKLYKKGNCQGRKYRRLSGWQFYEFQRQAEYKARWEGLPVEFVDPGRTSRQCPRCGKILQEDTQHRRKMLCGNCGLFMDRDVIAAMNIAHKGVCKLSPRLGDSRDGTDKVQSGTFEPAMSEPRAPAIRIVDMSKGAKL